MSFTRVGAYPYYQRGRLENQTDIWEEIGNQQTKRIWIRLVPWYTPFQGTLSLCSSLHFHIFFCATVYVYKWSHQHFTHSLLWILTWILAKSTFILSTRMAFIFLISDSLLRTVLYLYQITKIRTNKRASVLCRLIAGISSCNRKWNIKKCEEIRIFFLWKNYKRSFRFFKIQFLDFE